MSVTRSLARNLNALANKVKPRKPSGYRLFDLVLVRRRKVSASLTSLVFTGEDAIAIRTLAPDQRIKLFFPAPDGSLAALPHNGDWLAALRAMPTPQRPAMRTYTIRSLNPARAEVEVEFVLHGETGPASTWATHAKPGARLQMLAPDACFAGDPGGYEWQPPQGVRHVLLIGDETALPAIAGALEQMAGWPEPPQVEAFIEVPQEADRLAIAGPPTARVVWLPRAPGQQAHGAGMRRAALELAQLPANALPVEAPGPLKHVDIEKEILWERAAPANAHFYAWVAGESAAVMAIRRYLVSERGLDRRGMTFMGYWREGRVFE